MHLGRLEPLDALHLRRADQGAVECVGPAVILALERVALAAALRHRTGPMEADVVEGAQRVVIAQHHERIVADRGSEELAVLLHLIDAPYELPGVREDPLALQLEVDGIVVQSRRNRRGAFDVRIERKDEGHEGRYVARMPDGVEARWPDGSGHRVSAVQGSVTNCPRKARASSVSVR